MIEPRVSVLEGDLEDSDNDNDAEAEHASKLLPGEYPPSDKGSTDSKDE